MIKTMRLDERGQVKKFVPRSVPNAPRDFSLSERRQVSDPSPLSSSLGDAAPPESPTTPYFLPNPRTNSTACSTQAARAASSRMPPGSSSTQPVMGRPVMSNSRTKG